MSIEENIKSFLSELENVQLVCVTKNVDVDNINKAINAGADIIGESKIQEFENKYNLLLPCKKHFIGHLQTNKVKKAVKWFDVIESVDSLKLITDINEKASEIKKIQEIFLQINIGNETQKYGFYLSEIENIINTLEIYHNIKITGLMCIAPNISSQNVRPYFKHMNKLFEKIKILNNYSNIHLQYLSMGMSGDYKIAIEEGANIVRIGSAIFRESVQLKLNKD